MREVISAEYLEAYTLLVTFDTGEVKLVDLENCLWGEAFTPLKDLAVFKAFRVDWGTVTWCDGQADFAPEFLYEQGKEVKGEPLNKHGT